MKAEVFRKTNEVEVEIKINLEGGEISVETGIPFLNHMLTTFAKHSGVGLKIKAKGDLEVDEHHTIEDVAIALGMAIKKALGDKKGISRFGDAIVPMDESVTICGVDLSGRGILILEGELGDVSIKAENIFHFLDTFCRNAGINAYISVKGLNAHHKVESIFKALALSFREAIKKEGEDVKSVKGVID